MEKITAVILSIISVISTFFGMAGSPDYSKTTGLVPFFESLVNKETILDTEYIGEVSDEEWDSTQEYSFEDTIVLKKEKDKDFVILNITDAHFADYGEKIIYIPATVNIIRTMVANVKPDLITVTGDIVCTDSDYYAIRKFTDLMEGFGIPWAPVFGNHDDEGNCDLNFLADVMMTAPNCIMKKGDPEMGVGNYIINVVEENDDDTVKVVESIIMMDSHHSQPNEKQVEWYKWASDGINALSNKEAEITMFCHIPIPEYQLAYDLAWNSENKSWREEYKAYGELNEKICCNRDAEGNPSSNGLFDVMKNSETTKFVFCGHEHLNNFSILYEGIRLTYTMKAGHASGYRLNFNGGTEIRVGNNGIENISHKTAFFGPVITLENINTKN